TSTTRRRRPATATPKPTATARKAEQQASDLRRTTRDLVVDSAYAWFGVGDRAVELAREFPALAKELGSKVATDTRERVAKAQSLLKDAPHRVSTVLEEARHTAQ